MDVPTLTLDAFTEVPFALVAREELRRRQLLQVEALGRKLAVVWNRGRPRVFEDSCPHLGLPMTLGAYKDDRLRCSYHGWTFLADDGSLVEQPTLRKAQPCRLIQYGCLLAGDPIIPMGLSSDGRGLHIAANELYEEFSWGLSDDGIAAAPTLGYPAVAGPAECPAGTQGFDTCMELWPLVAGQLGLSDDDDSAGGDDDDESDDDDTDTSVHDAGTGEPGGDGGIGGCCGSGDNSGSPNSVWVPLVFGLALSGRRRPRGRQHEVPPAAGVRR